MEGWGGVLSLFISAAVLSKLWTMPLWQYGNQTLNTFWITSKRSSTHCALSIYTSCLTPCYWKELGVQFLVRSPAHIPAMMHLIGWQPCSNQLNDRQTGSEHSCTVQSKPIVWQSEAAILGFPPPTENRFQWISWPSGIIIMQKAQQRKVVCSTIVLTFFPIA